MRQHPSFDILVIPMPVQPDMVPSALETRGLDGHAWAGSVSARAFGVRFGIRVDDATRIPAILRRLPPGSRVCDRARDHAVRYSITTAADTSAEHGSTRWRVYADDRLEVDEPDEASALRGFEGLVRFDVARLAARWTFVHAGVVEWHGRAILIPGISYSGKSRLIEALVRAGAGYYSDEYAALDRRGRVHPFAKPLTIRRDVGGIDEVEVEASTIGGANGTRALQVGLVVATHYVSGAKWQPVSVSDGGTVLALLAHTVRAQLAPARVMRTLAHVATTAVTLEGERGEAAQTADEILKRALP